MSVLLCCPTSALDVILSVATHPSRSEAVCLLLNEYHCVRSSFVIAKAPRDLGSLTSALSGICEALPWVRAVIFATLSNGSGTVPNAAEQIDFLDCRERFSVIGVDLIDWFILNAGVAASVAEITDARSLWRHAGGSSGCAPVGASQA